MSLDLSNTELLTLIKKAFKQAEEAPEVTSFSYYVDTTDLEKHGFHVYVEPGDRLYKTKYLNYFIKHPDQTCTWYGDGQRPPFPVESIEIPHHATRVTKRTIETQHQRN